LIGLDVFAPVSINATIHNVTECNHGWKVKNGVIGLGNSAASIGPDGGAGTGRKQVFSPTRFRKAGSSGGNGTSLAQDMAANASAAWPARKPEMLELDDGRTFCFTRVIAQKLP
jgi:hypothetical protein